MTYLSDLFLIHSKPFSSTAMSLKGIGFIKVIFILTLIILFVKYFGIVSIKKYLDRGVLMKISKKSFPEGVIAPSATVCAMNPKNKTGWKTDFKSACAGKSDEDLEDCVNNSAYNLNDYMPEDIFTEYDLIPDITAARFGKCFTLEITVRINSTIGKESLGMPLNNSFGYVIFIHDPGFFFLTLNPRAIPGFRKIIKPNELKISEVLFQTIEISEHNNLNREEQPCREDENYSFSSCLRTGMESIIGCVMPWNNDKDNATGVVECKTWEQYQHFMEKYTELALMELQDVVKYTECPVPCNYRAIKAIDKPETFPNTIEFVEYGVYGFTLVSTDIQVYTEEYIYSFAGLVSDIGGALGLFIGFSFIMFWDWILYSVNFVRIFFH